MSDFNKKNTKDELQKIDKKLKTELEKQKGVVAKLEDLPKEVQEAVKKSQKLLTEAKEAGHGEHKNSTIRKTAESIGNTYKKINEARKGTPPRSGGQYGGRG